MLNRHRNVVLSLNQIQEGLNFVVPKDWWNEFLHMNKYVQYTQQILLPNYHPLQVLSQIGIISQSFHQELLNIKRLHQNAQNQASYLHGQLQIIRTEEREKGIKRNRPIFEWWDFQTINFANGFSKVLICPLIRQQMLEALSLNIEWKVVTPKLYKLICSKEQMLKGQEYKNYLVGIPILLSGRELGVTINDCYKRDMDYMMGIQTPSSVYFYNGLKYGIVGYLQNKLTYGQMLRYLFNGLVTLSEEEVNQKPRQIVSFVEEQVYSNISDSQKVFTKCSPLQKLNKKSLHNSISVIQFSCYCDPEQIDNKQLFKQKEPVKKIKENSYIQATYISNVSKATSIPPTIISSITPKLQQRMNRFNKIKKQNPSFFNKHIQKSNSDSVIMLQQLQWADPVGLMASTYDIPNARVSINDEQTRSQDFPTSNTKFQEYKQMIKADQNRIGHTIWKKQYKNKQLVKLSKSKINEHIPIPLSDHKQTLKIRNNMKVCFSHKYNKLAYDQEGKLLEQEQFKTQEQRRATEDLIKYLQNLALQVTGKKQHIKREIVCKEVIEFKDKFEAESQACKNEDIDLEQAQSRQC